MLSCSIRFSASNFWMGGGFESRGVGRVYGADVAVRQRPVPDNTQHSQQTNIHAPGWILSRRAATDRAATGSVVLHIASINSVSFVYLED